MQLALAQHLDHIAKRAPSGSSNSMIFGFMQSERGIAARRRWLRPDGHKKDLLIERVYSFSQKQETLHR